MKKNVGILIFDDAEVLDFAGPFEVFAVTSEISNDPPFNVFTFSERGTLIKAVNGFTVLPNYSFSNHPPIDILIISGGGGTKKLLHYPKFLQSLKAIILKAELTLSICSASRLLGALGLLDEKRFCTHHEVYEHMKTIAPKAIPQPEQRFIQTDERIYTSGGISAGIDLSFHVVGMLLGKDVAQRTADYMEYNYLPSDVAVYSPIKNVA
jgi:transcriptional regulator GlxA family with amidase domain